MTKTIRATYVNGVLKPAEPLALAEGAEVELTMTTATEEDDPLAGLIGAFSSGGINDDYPATFPSLDAKANAQIKLLWIACGTDDRLIDTNRKIRAFLTSKDVKHTAVETPGAHVWMVWRRNLAEFTPLLFKP